MSIGQKIYLPICYKDTKWDTHILLCWCNSLFGTTLPLLCFWSGEGDKNSIPLVRMMETSVIVILRGVQVLVLGGCAQFAVIMRSHMMVGVAPVAAAQARARIGMRARRRS
jgi:hypothetical protein